MRPFTVVLLTIISLAVLLGIGYAIIIAKSNASLREKEEAEAQIRAREGSDVIID